MLPGSEFWSKTTHRRTPGPALLLHWIFTVLLIGITPLDLANGYSVISTFYSYIHTYIGSQYFLHSLSHHLDRIVPTNVLSQSCLASPYCVPHGYPASSTLTAVKILVSNLKAPSLGTGSSALLRQSTLLPTLLCSGFHGIQ